MAPRTRDLISLVSFLFAALYVLPALSEAPAAGGDWPQWRGARRDGLSTETGLLKEWPEGGPRLLWTAKDAGKAYSSVSIASGRLYTLGDREDGSYLIAYDVAGGKQVWAAKNGPIYPNTRGGGPRGTPTVDGEMVYALSGGGNLIAAESATGKERFSFNIFKEWKGACPHWGSSESPLVEKDLLIVTPGGELATVVALDKSTGKPVWKLEEKDKAGYSSAIACDAAGIRQVIAFTARGALGIRAADGKLLWRNDDASNPVANIATAVVRGDHVFISSDYMSKGGVLLKLEKDGEGVKAVPVWQKQEMKTHHATALLVGDHLYGVSGNSPAVLTCMEFLTGKVVYPAGDDRRKAEKALQKSGIVYADGHIYCLGEEGEAALVEANPKELVVKSRFHAFDEKQDPGQTHRKKLNTWSHPVVAGGRLYLRNHDQIYCYDIKASDREEKPPSSP